MSDRLKIAWIAAATILLGLGAWIYFSPYQTCVRAQAELGKGVWANPGDVAKASCADGSTPPANKAPAK